MLLAFAVLVSVMLEFLLVCLSLRSLGTGYTPVVINFIQAAVSMVLLALFFRRQAGHA